MTTTKNGVNTLSPQEKKREKYLEKEYQELFTLLNPKQAEERLKGNTASQESYPIKNFLLEKSCLVQFQAKEAIGQSLTKAEQAKEKRIYDLRDKVFANIQKELAKYYQVVIQGNYHLDGFPKISGGIKGWAEKKIWRLLARLGEPNCFPYQDKYEGFWDAKDQK